MKKLIIGLILLGLLGINFISAAGLCRGNDGYYHDCDDSRYFEKNNDQYYYHGNYYPASNSYTLDRDNEYRNRYGYGQTYNSYGYNNYQNDYYGNNYYKPSSCCSRSDDNGLAYIDTLEHTTTTQYKYEDRGISENIKKIVYEKTETDSYYDIPHLIAMGYYNQDKNTNQNTNQNANSNANSGGFWDFLYNVNHPVPNAAY